MRLSGATKSVGSHLSKTYWGATKRAWQSSFLSDETNEVVGAFASVRVGLGDSTTT